jgi:hypothetical protein
MKRQFIFLPAIAAALSLPAGCARSSDDEAAQAKTEADATKAEPAKRTDSVTQDAGATKGKTPDRSSDATATGTGRIIDPPSNLTGDPTRKFMDIVEATIRSDGNNFVLEILTAAPFPSPSEMAGGKRFDFIWFIDIDKQRSTGQSDRGNDYNIHLFLDESGWKTAWFKVSSVSENDKVAIRPDDFQIRVEGSRASLAFPKRYLPGQSFEMWATCFSGNAPQWVPQTENPPTERAVFNF